MFTCRLSRASSLFRQTTTSTTIASRYGNIIPTTIQQRQQHHVQQRKYSCQIQYPTKLGQLRAKFRKFGQGHIELDLNHSTGLGLVTIHNPEKHNALTGKMIAELADLVDFLEQATAPTTKTSTGAINYNSNNNTDTNADIAPPQLLPESGLVLKCAGSPINTLTQEHVDILNNLVGIIITGSPNKSYCAGLDISAAKATLLTPQAGSEMSALMVSTLTRFLRIPLITIAAIEKAAIGGGAEMTTFTDHRCISENAKVQFVQTEMGVVPGWGGGSRLLNIVNRSLAIRLLAAAEPLLGGQEAIQSGFAQIVAPPQKTLQVATEYMQRYVWHKTPTIEGDESSGSRRCIPAVRAMKRIVSHGMDHERVDRVSEFEKDLFGQFWGSPDNLARVEAAFSGNKKK
ncbi:enoyl CoA hydratase domain-containing protein 1 [Haplosporangium sp. Z 27]|nr:enoyl CoA hydratase domain-containing protein 1 [Haplosporangium sp. Z 27]